MKIYFHYFLQFLKARLQYRADFFASVFTNMLLTVTGLLFVVFLVDGETVTSLQGWSREEVLFIYGYSMISLAFFSVLVPNLYGFGDKYVIQGQFDRVLLRPLYSLSQVMFESFNLDSFGSLLLGVLTIIHSARRLGLHFGVVDIVWLLVSSVSGGIILLSVFIILASMSFHFEDRIGIAPPFYNIITFGRYPMTIFHRTIQFLLSWVLPFAFVAFYPATHFFNRPEFRFFCYCTPLMALLSLIAAVAAWEFGVSRYESTGN